MRHPNRKALNQKESDFQMTLQKYHHIPADEGFTVSDYKMLFLFRGGWSEAYKILQVSRLHKTYVHQMCYPLAFLFSDWE